jgi:hypothetical protein
MGDPSGMMSSATAWWELRFVGSNYKNKGRETHDSDKFLDGGMEAQSLVHYCVEEGKSLHELIPGRIRVRESFNELFAQRDLQFGTPAHLDETPLGYIRSVADGDARYKLTLIEATRVTVISIRLLR